MTRDEARQLLPIIQAYAEGRELEFRPGREWKPCPCPDFSYPPDSYRIKPEPVECWAVVSRENAIFQSYAIQSRGIAEKHAAGTGCRVIRMREVHE